MSAQTPHNTSSAKVAAPAQSTSNKLISAIQQLLLPGEQTTNSRHSKEQHPLFQRYGDAFEFLIQGDAYLGQDQVELAIKCYEQAITHQPSFYEAYYGLGRCFRRQGDLKKALIAFKKSISINQFNGEAHQELAKTFHEAGNLPMGIRHFRLAVKLKPDDVEVRFNLALCLELDEQFSAASKLYDEIIELDDQFAPAYNNYGSILMRQGKYRQAESLFRELIALTPGFNRAYLGLAICLDRTNRPKEALPFYERLLVGKFNTRNREFIEGRVRTIRRYVGLPTYTTAGGNQLVRVK